MHATPRVTPSTVFRRRQGVTISGGRVVSEGGGGNESSAPLETFEEFVFLFFVTTIDQAGRRILAVRQQ